MQPVNINTIININSTKRNDENKTELQPTQGELGTVPMIHFPKEMVSRSEKFGTVPVFHAAATKKKQTEIKHFNINNKNEKDSAPDLWSLV